MYCFFTVVIAVFSTAFFISVLDSGLIIGRERLCDILSSGFFGIVIFFACVVVTLKYSRKVVLNRLLFFAFLLFGIISVLFFVLVRSGLINKVDSVEDLRAFISSFGAYAAVLYVLIQFMQVAIVPIPSVITVGAGVLMFGPFTAAILGVIGIITGSFFAFFVGRRLGKKAVIWLIGLNNLEKGLKFIEGKDRILLTFMFVFPFFPDDILCFAAGLTKIKTSFFVLMILIVRTITVFISCYSINNSLIPYDTWWGAVIWIVYFIFAVIAAIFIYKKGDKIENFIRKRFLKTER